MAESRPGQPFWAAHLGPDPDAARSFYASVLGWSFADVAPDDASPFWIASLDGDRVASLTGPQDPAVWIVAVAVDDLDAAKEAAVRSGGSAPGETIDIPTLGRFHRLHDPSGAEVHAVRPLGTAAGTTSVDVPGSWESAVLAGADPSVVAPFYEAVFGWAGWPETEPRVEVDLAEREGTSAWIPCFGVDDVDAAVATALAHGGALVGRQERAGRVHLGDPTEATFALGRISRGRDG